MTNLNSHHVRIAFSLILSLLIVCFWVTYVRYTICLFLHSISPPLSQLELCFGDVNIWILLTIFIFFILFFVFAPSNCFSFFLTSDVHQPLSQIRISLASSLGAGQAIFLAGINATGNTVRTFPRFVESQFAAVLIWWFVHSRG